MVDGEAVVINAVVRQRRGDEDLRFFPVVVGWLALVGEGGPERAVEVFFAGSPETENEVEVVLVVADEAYVGLAEIFAAGADGFGPAGVGVVGFERAEVLEGAAVGADDDVEVAFAVDRDAGGVVAVVGGRAETHENGFTGGAGFAVVGGDVGGNAGDFFGFRLGIGGFAPDDVDFRAAGNDHRRNAGVHRAVEGDLGQFRRFVEGEFSVAGDVGDDEFDVVGAAPAELGGAAGDRDAAGAVGAGEADDGGRAVGDVVSGELLDVPGAGLVFASFDDVGGEGFAVVGGAEEGDGSAGRGEEVDVVGGIEGDFCADAGPGAGVGFGIGLGDGLAEVGGGPAFRGLAVKGSAVEHEAAIFDVEIDLVGDRVIGVVAELAVFVGVGAEDVGELEGIADGGWAAFYPQGSVGGNAGIVAGSGAEVDELFAVSAGRGVADGDFAAFLGVEGNGFFGEAGGPGLVGEFEGEIEGAGAGGVVVEGEGNFAGFVWIGVDGALVGGDEPAVFEEREPGFGDGGPDGLVGEEVVSFPMGDASDFEKEAGVGDLETPRAVAAILGGGDGERGGSFGLGRAGGAEVFADFGAAFGDDGDFGNEFSGGVEEAERGGIGEKGFGCDGEFAGAREEGDFGGAVGIVHDDRFAVALVAMAASGFEDPAGGVGFDGPFDVYAMVVGGEKDLEEVDSGTFDVGAQGGGLDGGFFGGIRVGGGGDGDVFDHLAVGAEEHCLKFAASPRGGGEVAFEDADFERTGFHEQVRAAGADGGPGHFAGSLLGAGGGNECEKREGEEERKEDSGHVGVFWIGCRR